MPRAPELHARFGSRYVAATVVVVAAAVGFGITHLPVWRNLEWRIFDWLLVRSAANEVKLPITIVGIDQAALHALDISWPPPRRLHAKLLDNLAEAGAAVVGFDIPFAQLSSPPEDDAFIVAVQRFGPVVLAAEHAYREGALVRHWERVDPHALFLLGGASQGYASFEVDADAVLRRVPTVSDAFWRAVLVEFDRRRPGVVETMDATDDMLIRYAGGPHLFTYVPYQHLLEPDRHLPKGWRDFFRDNIVLVGRDAHVIQDIGASQGEMFQTPFFHSRREFMPRVEVHANLIAAMIAGDTLRRAPWAWGFAVWLAAALAGFLFLRGWHPLRSGVTLALMTLALAALEFVVFERLKIWLPVAGAVLTLGLIYGSQGALAFIAEQRQRREIRNAFSMYVSPAVVDQMIAHPERLKLGGERRELTILFTDLAGFTSIAEKLEPEDVAALVNRHLSDVTEAILRNEGTVDKFTGDGVMAFWGAPISDERQSERAVQAALEIAARTRALAEETQAETGARLMVRVGIHRGHCVVGNMGGTNRFNYSLMGDAANLASRLEGANKAYGTTILVGEAVVAGAGGHLRFREVDTVRVKGKEIGITVFTPCEDAALVKASDEALAAYRAGDFDRAAVVWKRLLESYPDDPVSTTLLERLEVLRTEAKPQDWDGVTNLVEK